MKNKIYLYKEYNDETAYQKEITMLFPTRKEARKHLKSRVKKNYGMSPKQMAEDPDFKDDAISKDSVIITNDGGDISFFIIETHKMPKKTIKADDAALIDELKRRGYTVVPDDCHE